MHGQQNINFVIVEARYFGAVQVVTVASAFIFNNITLPDDRGGTCLGSGATDLLYYMLQ
jgi:hypothetical protein